MNFQPTGPNSDRHWFQHHSANGRPSHDNAKRTGKGEVSAVRVREYWDEVVVYHNRNMGGEITRSPDGQNLWEAMCGVR